jgi:hypothetical protein
MEGDAFNNASQRNPSLCFSTPLRLLRKPRSVAQRAIASQAPQNKASAAAGTPESARPLPTVQGSGAQLSKIVGTNEHYDIFRQCRTVTEERSRAKCCGSAPRLNTDSGPA